MTRLSMKLSKEYVTRMIKVWGERAEGRQQLDNRAKDSYSSIPRVTMT